MRLASSCLLVLFASLTTHADELLIAVASNFRSTAEMLAADFSTQSGHDVSISSASTGKLHAQLLHGAPFDVFLAADAEGPRLLEESGIAVHGSRFTYAIGELVLWSAADGASDCRAALNNPGEFRLALANPEVAPYGRAAKEFLITEKLWAPLSEQLVYGENVAQALHFAVSGNARFALIARAQAIDSRLPAATCFWMVPADSHTALTQQAVLLQRAADNVAASSFLHYLQTAEGRDTIRRSGYGVP